MARQRAWTAAMARALCSPCYAAGRLGRWQQPRNPALSRNERTSTVTGNFRQLLFVSECELLIVRDDLCGFCGIRRYQIDQPSESQSALSPCSRREHRCSAARGRRRRRGVRGEGAQHAGLEEHVIPRHPEDKPGTNQRVKRKEVQLLSKHTVISLPRFL